MSKDVKSDAPKRDWCYLGDDHCPEHGHGCQEYWCGNGPGPETNARREYLDAVTNGEEDFA